MGAIESRAEASWGSSNRPLLEATVEYFRSDHWRSIVQLVQERDLNHMHVYLETSLHPYDSLRPLVKGFFENLGWQVYKDVARLRSFPGVLTLYGVNLPDKAHFDIFTRFNPNVAVAPMARHLAERGRNLLVWWDQDIVRFHQHFRWRDLTESDTREIGRFFQESNHWGRALQKIRDPDVEHVHCNIETSVHPNVLRTHALEDLARRGWKVAHAIHSVFNAHGSDSGKIIFLGVDPARTYDIAWYHNSDVLIQANTQETNMVGDEGTSKEFFVLRLSQAERELCEHEFVSLMDHEIRWVLDQARDVHTRSSYSWRIVAK